MMQIGTASKPRMVLKITASVSSHQSTLIKLKIRLIQVIRRHSRIRSKKLPTGSILINLPKRRNMKRSRRNWRELPYPFCRKWEVALEECLEEYEEKQKELEGVALPILQKMGGGAG